MFLQFIPISRLKGYSIQISNCIFSDLFFFKTYLISFAFLMLMILKHFITYVFTVGTCADDLIAGVSSLTNGRIVGRFFSFFPARDVDLRAWLTAWIRLGAVPTMTLNLQKCVPFGSPIPDAWHHQMVHGVSSKGVVIVAYI